ncbi:hypothetical protein NDU88_002557 [Pleurodeles waltl]|uniref:Uncharacterized protein n=1 Tax=Pleurodeles waltl TaxID=8319 RepID=A0AAV7UVY5_PLEWA|nr:hypothetical protein NDU88_002557 [Pleurodeles waltl]
MAHLWSIRAAFQPPAVMRLLLRRTSPPRQAHGPAQASAAPQASSQFAPRRPLATRSPGRGQPLAVDPPAVGSKAGEFSSPFSVAPEGAGGSVGPQIPGRLQLAPCLHQRGASLPAAPKRHGGAHRCTQAATASRTLGSPDRGAHLPPTILVAGSRSGRSVRC